MSKYSFQRLFFIGTVLAFLHLYNWLSQNVQEVLYYFATRYADWYMGK